MSQSSTRHMDADDGTGVLGTTTDELKFKDALRDRYGESSDPLVNKETGEPIPEGYMSERKRIIWVPEGEDNAYGVTLPTFVEANDWEVGKGHYSERSRELESSLSVENTPTTGSTKHFDRMYAVTHGDTAHVLIADYVDTVATILGVSHTQLLDSAMMRPNESTFPVRFDTHIPGGSLLLTPIIDRFTEESPYDKMF